VQQFGFSNHLVSEMAGSHLSRLLLKLFASGELSGTQVQELAAAAWQDGWGRDNLLSGMLVRAGSSGRVRNKMANDVIAAAESAGLMCSKALPYRVRLSTGGYVLLFLPHEFYPAMLNEFGHGQMCFGTEALEADQGLPKLLKDWARHRDVQFGGDLTTVGVLGMHCDGVQYTSSMRAGGARSVVAGSMNVVSAVDNIRNR
jgi:hypothetical protein